jgi:hypothetical protein
VFQNGDLYTGDFKDDEFHGQGSWSSMAGATFVGEFRQGRRCGKGVFSDVSIQHPILLQSPKNRDPDLLKSAEF